MIFERYAANWHLFTGQHFQVKRNGRKVNSSRTSSRNEFNCDVYICERQNNVRKTGFFIIIFFTLDLLPQWHTNSAYFQSHQRDFKRKNEQPVSQQIYLMHNTQKNLRSPREVMHRNDSVRMISILIRPHPLQAVAAFNGVECVVRKESKLTEYIVPTINFHILPVFTVIRSDRV